MCSTTVTAVPSQFHCASYPQTPAIVINGYEWYQKASDEYQITCLGCWVHARRKFKEAKGVQPKGKIGKADQGLNYIKNYTVLNNKPKTCLRINVERYDFVISKYSVGSAHWLREKRPLPDRK
ncbi:IS66 family transposase [Marinomonas vulgaris]|uniref:IS66 family transposase n=1 Tax=Marinomonas vulgaris TaxID=2823372 RepID=UPI0038B2EF82